MKREQDEAYRISLEADRAKVCVGGEKTPWDGSPLEFGNALWCKGLPAFSCALNMRS